MNAARENGTDAQVIIENGAITSLGMGKPEWISGTERLKARDAIANPEREDSGADPDALRPSVSQRGVVVLPQ